MRQGSGAWFLEPQADVSKNDQLRFSRSLNLSQRLPHPFVCGIRAQHVDLASAFRKRIRNSPIQGNGHLKLAYVIKRPIDRFYIGRGRIGEKNIVPLIHRMERRETLTDDILAGDSGFGENEE